MNRHFRSIAFSLGAIALASFHAQAETPPADGADEPWPAQVPAQVYFVEPEGYDGDPRHPDASAAISLGNTTGQEGSIVLAAGQDQGEAGTSSGMQ